MQTHQKRILRSGLCLVPLNYTKAMQVSPAILQHSTLIGRAATRLMLIYWIPFSLLFLPRIIAFTCVLFFRKSLMPINTSITASRRGGPTPTNYHKPARAHRKQQRAVIERQHERRTMATFHRREAPTADGDSAPDGRWARPQRGRLPGSSSWRNAIWPPRDRLATTARRRWRPAGTMDGRRRRRVMNGRAAGPSNVTARPPHLTWPTMAAGVL